MRFKELPSEVRQSALETLQAVLSNLKPELSTACQDYQQKSVERLTQVIKEAFLTFTDNDGSGSD